MGVLRAVVKAFDIRHEEGRVILLFGGRLVTEMPWEVAEKLARVLMAKARQAEEHEKANQIAFDSAILMRSGAPFSFSNNPDILDIARNEAAWNSDLRKAMPGGVKSREVFGTPAVIRHPKGE